MKKIVFIIGCLPALFFTACQKELSDNFSTYANHPLNDTIWVKTVPGSASVHELISLLLPEIIIDSFDVAHDTTLKYGDSLEISFTAGSCIGTGGTGTLTGKARLELMRLRTKGDYIKTFKPTTSNAYLLETAGAFFIRVIKDGKELSLAPNATVKIRFSDTEDPKSNMQVFYGRESSPIPFTGIDTASNWIRDTDSTWLKTFQKSSSGPGPGIKGYELISKNLRWVAAERFVDSTRSKAKITAILSPNFTNKNTAVFAVFTDQKTVVNLRGDYPSRSFAAANIPLGSKIKLVSISRIGNDLYLGTKDINDVGTTVAYSIKPEIKSLKEILVFLNGL
jgi:hypothetical protein